MRTVVFVCEHGAGRSRVAAALFNAHQPPGWCAESAGLTPQDKVSGYAAGMLGDAAAFLDDSPPKPLARAPGDLTIGIDCDPPGARRWTLNAHWPDPATGAELGELTAALVNELSAADEATR
jgi:hypothetical protein